MNFVGIECIVTHFIAHNDQGYGLKILMWRKGLLNPIQDREGGRFDPQCLQIAVKDLFLAVNHIPSVVFPRILFDNRKKHEKMIFDKMAVLEGVCEGHVDLFWTFAIPKK